MICKRCDGDGVIVVLGKTEKCPECDGTFLTNEEYKQAKILFAPLSTT